MLSSEHLRDEWHERACSHPFAPTMTLTDQGLVLGAGTVLAKRRSIAGRPFLALDGAEERIVTLLSAAHRRAVNANVLANIRRAAAAWSDGEPVLALIHLAHTGLPPLDEEAGYRLFTADQLLASGIEARILLKACDIDTAVVGLLKGYNPDEPRVPAGNPDGGEWTYGDGAPPQHGRQPPAGSGPHPPRPPATTAPARKPSQYTIIHGTPADAKAVVPPDGRTVIDPKSGKPLLAPVRADFREVYAAGRAIASLRPSEQYRQARGAIAQEGTYDFQRDFATRRFYPAYTPAANYGVGVYMAGAGYPLSETLALSKLYAFRYSSNYSAQDRENWITRGWTDAHSGRWR